jgi:hypothetical protein
MIFSIKENYKYICTCLIALCFHTEDFRNPYPLSDSNIVIKLEIDIWETHVALMRKTINL